MTRPFVRLSAQAAIVGGLLRIAASFAPYSSCLTWRGNPSTLPSMSV
jgi:hypothetical protein